MTQLLISADARVDLEGIFDFVSRDRPRAAIELVDRIAARMKLLCLSPEMGESCEFLGAGIRRALVGSYSIYYSWTHVDVSVLRVIRGVRELPAAFLDPPGT